MKVLQVIPDFGVGGAEIMCENLIYELKALKHEVVVISLFDSHSAITERLEKAGIKIYYLHKKVGPDFSVVAPIRDILTAEKPDAIHTHRNALQYAFCAARKLHIPIVHTIHAIAKKENAYLSRKFNGFLFKHFNVTPVALSRLVQDTIVQEYHLPPEKIPIIFNGVRLSNCIPKTDYSSRELFTIIHVARFSKVKNHQRLVSAFKIFHDYNPQSRLWLVGDGLERPEIEEQVRNLHLEDCVVFWGVQENVFPLLHDADVFTLPSDYEGMPMTIIEAMGTGLPVVATSVGGVPDMIENGKSGILCESNAKSIAQAFCSLYESRNLRESLGRCAAESAKAFSAGKMAENYLKLYSK